MKVERLGIPDVLMFHPEKRGDERGYFAETFRQSLLTEMGVNHGFVQDNVAMSAEAGVVRGLHFQMPNVAGDHLMPLQRCQWKWLGWSWALRPSQQDCQLARPRYCLVRRHRSGWAG